jgi:glycosyltransferase involved in cell wall biosynthesis
MKALIGSTRMPEYDRECGSKRIFDVVQILRDAGWDIAYVARDDEGQDRYARALRQDGVLTYAGFDKLTNEFLAQARFDIAILAFWHVAEAWLPRLRRVSPATRVIVDSIDLHFLRSARGVFTRPPSDAVATALPVNIGDEFVRELNTYAAADGLLAVSPKETSLIADLIGNPHAVRCVPLCEELPRSPLPFAERRGVLFVGNFWHQPNVEAANHLVSDILPRVNPRLLAEHPLWIVGNASDDKVAQLGLAPHVHVVGWVPSVLPYLSRARVMTVPLRYGAGTKGKLIQSLAVGTPVVSTSVGIEGLDVMDARDVIVADDAAAFAKSIETLLTNEEVWVRLADRGHTHMAANHSHEVVKERLLNAIEHFRTRSHTLMLSAPPWAATYEQVCDATKAAIERNVPPGAAVAVISKGDEALLKLDNRRGEHFPQLRDGRYAGSYPADGKAAVKSLERLKARGVDFLAVPRTALWWLDYYKEFAAYLERTGSPVFRGDDCVIYGLSAEARRVASATTQPQADTRRKRRARTVPRDIEELRPRIVASSDALTGNRTKPRTLVLGIYLCGQPNNAADEIATLRASTRCVLDQRWVALGGPAPANLAEVTVASVLEKTPKFEILNRLIGSVQLADYDYFVSIDDDIVLPHGFLDAFIALQQQLGFALAQPARTSDSYLDHPIVEQQRGLIARQTRFVEIGPVFSMHRAIFDLLLPFDVTSSMGWGYENVWSYLLQQRGLKMGIIDAVPVCHGLRKSVANYGWDQADAERTAYWARHPHLTLDQCFRVTDIVGLPEGSHA